MAIERTTVLLQSYVIICVCFSSYLVAMM